MYERVCHALMTINWIFLLAIYFFLQDLLYSQNQMKIWATAC